MNSVLRELERPRACIPLWNYRYCKTSVQMKAWASSPLMDG